MKKSILAIAIICFLAVFSFADKLNSIPPLERFVSLDIDEVSVDKALDIIAKQADISFSYNPQNIPIQKTVKLNYNEKPVRWVLDNIFQGAVIYKTRGDYIILQKNKNSVPKNLPPKELRLSGYILDASNGTKISGVSLFDTISFHSEITDQHGHFEFVLHPETKAVSLLVKKEGYLDTSIFIEKTGFKLLLISLNQSEVQEASADTVLEKADSSQNVISQDTVIGEYNWLDFNLKEEIPNALKELERSLNEILQINSTNIKDTFHRDWQVSLLPGISTNRKMGSQVINDYSFNLLGGYTGGTNVFEIGGLFNMSKGNVKFAQVAGLSNIVEGNMFGVQAGGVVNFVKKNFEGVQVGGLVNITSGHFNGLQLSGLINSSASLEGVQAAGLFNSASQSVYGAQVAGIFNSTKEIKGIQVAGLVNRAKQVEGVQIAGILNKTSYLKGVQIGLINICDSAKGISIGLFNFVKYGYHKLEIGYTELKQVQLSFRTGTRALHNIFSFSMDPNLEKNVNWRFGYGLGSSVKLAKRLSLDIDLAAYHVEKGKIDWNLSDMAQLYLGLDAHFAKKFSLAFGPTFNLYALDRFHPDFVNLSSNIQKPVFNEVIEQDYRLIGWFGGRVALRFF